MDEAKLKIIAQMPDDCLRSFKSTPIYLALKSRRDVARIILSGEFNDDKQKLNELNGMIKGWNDNIELHLLILNL